VPSGPSGKKTLQHGSDQKIDWYRGTDRVIKAGRAKAAAQARLDEALRKEDGPAAPGGGAKIGSRLRSHNAKKAGEKEAAVDVEVEEKAAEDVQDTKEKVKVHEGEAHARVVTEGKMRERAAKMAARLAEQKRVSARTRHKHKDTHQFE
jgi:hypothetical protein